jgi:hypothetical protein
MLFIDALQSKEEMRAFCKVAPHVPKMANMLEGGGKTPLCSLAELEDMGFKLVAYPLSLFGVSVRGGQRAVLTRPCGVCHRLPQRSLHSFTHNSPRVAKTLNHGLTL